MAAIIDEKGKITFIKRDPAKWKELARKTEKIKKNMKIYRVEIDEKDWKIQDLTIISVGSEDGKTVIYIEGKNPPSLQQLEKIIERLNNKFKIKDVREVI